MDKKVLIIDDERQIVDFLKNFLSRLGIEAVGALSGEEGLKIYQKEEFNAVFLDIQMKGISGLEVLKLIKDKNSQAKVLMITAKEDQATREQADEIGVLDYITKPLDLRELKEKISTYLK
jgi:DNA-binding response OmpR family regulator